MIDHPSSRRALVVEDEPSWQEILNEILSDSGLLVDSAAALPQALKLASQGVYDLAVVDLSLEASDPHNQAGLQVLDAIKSANPTCQSVLLTGFATVELAVNALTEHGALTCLRKETFQRSSFRQLISQALQASRPDHGAQANPTGDVPGSSILDAQTTVSLEPRSLPVLLVEDDHGWQNILAELLEEAGQVVHLCNGFGEALGRLRREKYALAIVDLSLVEGGAGWNYSEPAWQAPDFTGFRLLASMRAAGIPTIVVSGVSSPEEIERAYEEYGIFAYLQKQVFSRKTFLGTVSEALSTRPTQNELAGLTDRERQVFDLLAQGMTNKEIAEALVISTNTIKRHLKAIFNKLHIHTRSAAAKFK